MSNSSAIVYLVDDEPSVRKALARLLGAAGHQVETFESARAFLQRGPKADGPACLVLDMQMPELTGLDLQRELKTKNSILPIIFVSGHSDVPVSVNAMKAGAVDFLTKPVQDHELLHAIERAHLHSALQIRAKAERDDLLARIERLTPREREVMLLVVAGRLNKQIADELGTVEKTIKVHRARVMTKMEADSVADLVRIVEKAGPRPADIARDMPAS